MLLRGLIDEDFVNYKKASMFLIFPYCSFKCERDCGIKCCQNSPLMQRAIIQADEDQIIDRYLQNPITKAIVMGGMEPLDSFGELINFVKKLREKTADPVVIYTGYNKDEISHYITELAQYSNIIVKFGRFIPNAQHRYDAVLGVELASDNQFAEQIS